MRKNILSLTAALLLALPLSAAEPLPWHQELEPALAEAAKHDRLVFVDLFADWCGWCRVLDEKVFSTERFADYAADKFVLVRLDVEDGAEGTRTQVRYGGTKLPTILILDPNRALAGKVQGMAPLDRYLGKLEGEVRRYRRLIQTFDSVDDDTGNAQLRALADTFHKRLDGDRAAQLYRRLAKRGWQELAGPGWLSYRLADALRLSGDLEGARAAATEARRIATAGEDHQLTEMVDLLGIEIASEAGSCDHQREALQAFLRDYPQSDHRARVESVLGALERGEMATSCS